MFRTCIRGALLILLCAGTAHAQNWTGILDSTHAIDWRNTPGVNFVIPSAGWTQCGTTITPYTGSTAAINSAIAACGANHFVLLGAGVFNFNAGCINWAGHSFVELRGTGPLLTILKFSSTCPGYSGSTTIGLWDAINGGGVYDGRPSVQPGGSNALSITGTTEGGAGSYPQGATHITVSGVGSDTPQVGYMLMIDQADETVPASGWLQCDASAPAPSCSANGGSSGRVVAGIRYSQVQVVTITAINGATYTITPGLYANNLRTSQNPGAWWTTGGSRLIQGGIRNLTVDSTVAAPLSALNWFNCYQCWVQNTRWIKGGGRNFFYVIQNDVGVIRDNYFFSSINVSNGGGYMIDPLESSDFLVENNISDEVPAFIVGEDYSGWVFGYNFTWNNRPGFHGGMNPSYPSHDPGSHMNLYEGNYFNGNSMDTQHGGSPTFTYFRNHFPGNQPVPFDGTDTGSVQNAVPFEIQANQHGESIIGNVLGIMLCSGGTFNGRPADEASQCTGGTLTSGSWSLDYEHSPNVGCAHSAYTSIYLLGYPSGCNLADGSNLKPDNEVANEMMRWGNCDTVTATCRFVAGEVPTTATSFLAALTVPVNNTLPASFYYNAKPAWYQSAYGNPPFPPIGPDVTGGDLVTRPAGHANRNPARLCYENTAQDATNYPSTAIISFDANVCYSGANTPTVSFSPVSLSFGNVSPLCLPSNSCPKLTMTVNNVGTGGLIFALSNSVTIAPNGGTPGGDFTLVGGNVCSNGAAIQAGGSCPIIVSFSPSLQNIPESATVTLADNAGTGTQTFTVAGIGLAPSPATSFAVLSGKIILGGGTILP